MTSASAHAKINLALVVGETRPDGLHEVATILQRVELADTISLEPADELAVEGFPADTIVRRALEAVAAAAGAEPRWRVRIEKRIPVAAGLGGGSSDAAIALKLAAAGPLRGRLAPARLVEIAAGLGADVPFFLDPGPKLGTGDGTELAALDLPQDYDVLLVLPHGEQKPSTGEVYGRFTGAAGFASRRELVVATAVAGPNADLAALPPNDLAQSSLAATLRALGAFRADVSGAGPVVYGLFRHRAAAEAAAAEAAARGEIWLTRPAW